MVREKSALRDPPRDDGRIEDASSHRLKITKQKESAGHHRVRKAKPTALCGHSLVCSGIPRLPTVVSARCSQCLQVVGWNETARGARGEEAHAARPETERETDRDPTLLGRICDVSLGQVVRPVRYVRW